jgi:hypothetical protein
MCGHCCGSLTRAPSEGIEDDDEDEGDSKMKILVERKERREWKATQFV